MASNGNGNLTLFIHSHMNGLRNIGPRSDASYKCLIENDPLSRFDEDNPFVPGEYKLIVQIFPHNERIYNNQTIRIEIKITSAYPISPPEVRILSQVFHPNVAKNGAKDVFLFDFSVEIHDFFLGQLCIPILVRGADYEPNLKFTQLIEKVTKVMDEPIRDLIQHTGSLFVDHFPIESKLFV